MKISCIDTIKCYYYSCINFHLLFGICSYADSTVISTDAVKEMKNMLKKLEVDPERVRLRLSNVKTIFITHVIHLRNTKVQTEKAELIENYTYHDQ